MAERCALRKRELDERARDKPRLRRERAHAAACAAAEAQAANAVLHEAQLNRSGDRAEERARSAKTPGAALLQARTLGVGKVVSALVTLCSQT